MSSIEIDPRRAGGKPVLKGTRFTIEQLLLEIVFDGNSIINVAEDFDLNEDDVYNAIREVALKMGT